jgi:hypothetical protein
MAEQLGQGETGGFDSLLQLGVSGGGSDLAAMHFGMRQTFEQDEATAMA